MFVRSRAPNGSFVANHRLPIRNTHIASRASHAISFRRKVDAMMAARRLTSRPRAQLSETELGFQEIVDGLRVRLAAGRLHHLADEPAERLRLRPGLRHLVRIGCDDLVDRLLDRREVGDLLHAARLDDGAGIAALLPDDLEQVLGNFTRDRALPDQADDGAQLLGGDWGAGNILAFLVQPPEQLVDHPVRRYLAVA